MSTAPQSARRALAALLCLPLTLPVRAVEVWPDPQPDNGQQQQQQAIKAVSRPTFRAPSATSCERPVSARLVPGPDYAGQQQEMARRIKSETRRTHDLAARAERADEGERSTDLRESLARAAAPAMATSPAPTMALPAPPEKRPPQPQQQDATVTAGVVDDNAGFGDYLAFRERNAQLPHRERDIRERYLLEVKDGAGRGLPDAELVVRSPAGAAMWARTDTAGRAWIHPDAFDPAHAQSYAVTARRLGREATTTLRRGQKSAVEVRLDVSTGRAPARLDLVFLVDATGSMGDEIDKLRTNMQAMVREIAALPSRPDLCLGLVAYRDRADEFLIKAHDLSNSVPGFQRALNELRADGGGDYPEAMNEALADTIANISWRGDGATRLVVLLADAPPHLDYEGPQYDQSMLDALGKGIKLFGVGASGLDRQGEYIQRQIAQYTGGKFVFLTYADARRPGSGPGRETTHEVQNYSVETLDKLVVRLVKEELAALR